MLFSNIKITKLEYKFDNLYQGLNEAQIIGTIITNGEETEYKKVYTLKVESINKDKRYKGTNLIIYTSKKADLEYGDLVKVNGMYEEQSSRTNYKAFDYREYLKEKNVYGIVKNIEDTKLVLKKNNLNPILMFFNKIKLKIKNNLEYILGERANLTKGILLRRYITNRRKCNRKF